MREGGRVEEIERENERERMRERERERGTEIESEREREAVQTDDASDNTATAGESSTALGVVQESTTK